MRHTVSPFLLPDLFFAGRAVLTFNNETKGTHMTVKVKQARDKQDRNPTRNKRIGSIKLNE